LINYIIGGRENSWEGRVLVEDRGSSLEDRRVLV
jgi:hypothetical protein